MLSYVNMDVITDKLTGCKFCLKTGNDASKHVIENGIKEHSLIQWCEQFLTPEGIFVDVGAHIGTYSILLHKRCKEVYAFEPQKDIFDCLTIGLCINNVFNAKTHNLALGSKEDSLSLHYTSDDGAGSTLRCEILQSSQSPLTSREQVPVKTLDSFGLKNVDFLKIDVEGYELEVIKGATTTLMENNFPPFIFDTFPDPWYKDDHDLLLAFVRSLGYKVHPISGYKNMYLASDHPLRPQREEPVKEEDKPKYDIKMLLEKHKDGKMDEPCEEWGCDEESKGEFKTAPWEAWYMLARHYRQNSQHKKSYECARKGLEASPPLEKQYLLYEEISIIAFYLDMKEEGLAACEKVILSSDAPWSTRNLALSNVGFYISPISMKRKIPLTHDMEALYTPSTASIVKRGDGYRINLRGINYYLSDKGYGVSRHGDGVIRTLNYILDTDKEFKVLSSCELKDKSGVQLYPKNVLGMEDVRLFGKSDKSGTGSNEEDCCVKCGTGQDEGTVCHPKSLPDSADKYFLCTYLELNESRTPQIGWGTYDDSGAVTRMVPLMAGSELRCEKNWLPFMVGDEIRIIYAVSPLQIYSLNKEDGSIKEILRCSLGDKYIKDFRGSASPIPYKSGWLITIHQVYHADPRKYFHRFVWFNQDFTDVKFSLPFYFDKVGVEFNLALCESEEGMLMTYSHWDASSQIAVVDYTVIDEMLGL